MASQAMALPRVGSRLGPIPARLVFALMLFTLAVMPVLSFALAVDSWTWIAWTALPLVAATAVWIAGGAATSILGLIAPSPKPQGPRQAWVPSGQTAILLTLCGEAPGPAARYLADLATGLARAGLSGQTRIHVLSDTSDPQDCAREDAALADLIASGRVLFRRRSVRTDRKPGNIADWLTSHGERTDYMVVLDADSRMSAASIRHLIWRLETNPKLGLCQAGIALVPGRTRFGRYQRLTSRLLGRTFARGYAAWSGRTGTYWGHNAILRVAAFREVARLPGLSGPAPFGGMILSHDVIEAAFIRRAGWHVELCPGLAGSAEDAPQTLEAYVKRDRRWCQGNLQHLRLIAAPALHPLSRYHLLTGIFSYLAAPIWLLLLLLLSSGALTVTGVWPVLTVATLLLIPKLCALLDARSMLRSRWRRGPVLRASRAELALSTLLAPLIMLRQALSVAAVLMARDCGWKSPSPARRPLPSGWPEAALGLALLIYAVAAAPAGAVWMAPVIGPLLAAPVLMPMMNEVTR